MKMIFKDSITGIILAFGSCAAFLGVHLTSNSIIDNILVVIMIICLCLFCLRLIRLWRGCAYNPPAHMAPILKLIFAIFVFIDAIMFWSLTNRKGNIIDIGITILIVMEAASELYSAIKIILNRNKSLNH